mmetsp:Transcript_10870/g.38138  ORF Transcript_10870/g.38138 Transcript_10870/m.38138 type:complete len:254 (-) Transcript_10870:734-1495(-)
MLGDCAHTFCKRCIAPLNPLRCPTCRRFFRPQSVLPNFALAALLNDAGFGASAVSSVRPPSEWAQGPAAAPAAQPSPAVALAGTGPASASATQVSPLRQLLGSLERDTAAPEGLGVERLMQLGLPAGLAKLVSDEDRKIALRVFLLDNSGSTAHPDGKVLIEEGGQQPRFQRCTRWEEITHMALEHARWNASIGTPVEFVLLNPPAAGGALEEGLDCIRIDASRGDVEGSIMQLEKLLRSTVPRGPVRNRACP